MYKHNGIYKIVNTINNKIYIGYTTLTFGDRRDSHFASLRGGYHFNNHLQEDFNKYGENNFRFDIVEIIEDCCSEDVYKEKEIYYISKYNTTQTGYNVSTGGNNFSGVRPSKDKIKMLSELNKKLNTNKSASIETKKKMSDAHNDKKIKINSSGSHILEKSDVKVIKKRLMSGESVNVIARDYEVTPGCISCINMNKNWKSVFVDGWDEYINNK